MNEISRLTIITGPMFSGKSEELLRLIKRAIHGRVPFTVIKPLIDTRQSTIRSRELHNGSSVTNGQYPANGVKNKDDFFQIIEQTQPRQLFIDEAQFFESWIVTAIDDIMRTNRLQVYISGLDQDAWGKTFGYMGDLMVLADEIKKLSAVCFVCGNAATMTFKARSGSGLLDIGDSEKYEARCRKCWQPPQ